MISGETVHSCRVHLADGSSVIFEYVVGRDVCSWYRMELDFCGGCVSLGRCSPAEVVQALADADLDLLLTETCRATDAMERAQARLLEQSGAIDEDQEIDVWAAQRAMHLRRARLCLLDQVVVACERLSGGAAESARSSATLQLLQRAAQETIRHDYPHRRGVPARLEHRLRG